MLLCVMHSLATTIMIVCLYLLLTATSGMLSDPSRQDCKGAALIFAIVTTNYCSNAGHKFSLLHFQEMCNCYKI